MTRRFPCPYCKGSGSWVEPVLDDGSGPECHCGFCGGDGMIAVGSEKHMDIKRNNPPKDFMWEWIGEIGCALDQTIDALEKLPEGGWSEREHLLQVCRKAREFHYEPIYQDTTPAAHGTETCGPEVQQPKTEGR